MNRQGAGDVFERNYLHSALSMDPSYSGSKIVGVGKDWGGGGGGESDGGDRGKIVKCFEEQMDSEWSLHDGGAWKKIEWLKITASEGEVGVLEVFAGGKLERVNTLKYTGFLLDI